VLVSGCVRVSRLGIIPIFLLKEPSLLVHHSLQSGHQTWLAAKWRFLAGTITYKWAIFQQAMFDYQMVGIPLKSKKYIPLSSPLLSIVAVIIKPSHDSPMIVQTWWNIINQIWVETPVRLGPLHSSPKVFMCRLGTWSVRWLRRPCVSGRISGWNHPVEAMGHEASSLG